MNNLLLTADNLGLTAGGIVGCLLFVLMFSLFIGTIIKIRKKKGHKRYDVIPYMVIYLLLSGVFAYTALLEFNLLSNYQYVEGTTLDYCSSGKHGGTGIEFEYYLDGKRYTNCNKGDLENVKVPGGKFKVRVSEFSPGIGRIDFDQPLTEDSKRD